MAIADVSGVGAGSKRVDQNMVTRIQNDAKIQNASGGKPGERKFNEESVQAAPIGSTGSSASQDIRMQRPKTDVVSPFAPGSVDRPPTDGMGGDTPGLSPNDLMANYNAVDPGSILVRAMYAASPTPQLRRMVEAYNEEGIF